MASSNRKLHVSWTPNRQRVWTPRGESGIRRPGEAKVAAVCLLTIGQFTITDRRPAVDLAGRQLDLVSNLSYPGPPRPCGAASGRGSSAARARHGLTCNSTPPRAASDAP